MPVARQLGVDPLHDGIILVVGMGICLLLIAFIPQISTALPRAMGY
jgi:TRAP-type C4-dicarboxylate transport system permease large subunit